MKLLIAEDDQDIVKVLVALFSHNNYSTDAVYNGKDAYDYAISGQYDGIIMDIMMPQMDGITVLKNLRKNNITTPVLLLTAKGDLEDRVEGLDAGADDYLPKPFAASELMARVRAMLRRKEQYQSDLLSYEGLSLNPRAFELSYNGNSLHLVSREYQMLEILLSRPNTVISTDYFMEKIWGWDSDVEVSVVWVYISNLRKRLDSLHAPISIKAMRGVGYSLEKK